MQHSVNFASVIPIKKRRYPVFESPSPPPNENPSTSADSKQEPRTFTAATDISDAINSSAVIVTNTSVEIFESKTFRQESSGKKQRNLNAKTMCKLDHLKNIAAWAATEASMPSLGAFLGQRLAATTEALGLRNDPALFLCERCECILQPGHNCTVRIEKNKSKGKHRFLGFTR